MGRARSGGRSSFRVTTRLAICCWRAGRGGGAVRWGAKWDWDASTKQPERRKKNDAKRRRAKVCRGRRGGMGQGAGERQHRRGGGERIAGEWAAVGGAGG